MQRRTLIAVLCAAAVGGTSGSLAALHLAHRRRAARIAAGSAAGAAGSGAAGSGAAAAGSEIGRAHV